MKELTVAICYDFDKTLSPKDMQEFGFFQDIGFNAEDFWANQALFIKSNNSDGMLANMYSMLKEAKKKGIKLNKEKFKEYGSRIELFDGVDSWFDRINKFGKSHGVNIEHYIVSSGIKEIIEGTTIAKYFKKIYACSYIYDENGEPIWPSISVNYTNKTQFLYRINKGCLEETDNSINNIINDDDRLVPFENMIYIGDSMTDIPCMRLVMKSGGKAIGVHSNSNTKKILKELLENNKINYIADADYSKGKTLDVIVKEVIKSCKINYNLKQLSKAQKVKARD